MSALSDVTDKAIGLLDKQLVSIEQEALSITNVPDKIAAAVAISKIVQILTNIGEQQHGKEEIQSRKPKESIQDVFADSSTEAD